MLPPPIDKLISLARNGDDSAVGSLLEHYRGYLRMVALRKLDARVQRRVDASDIVQQTFLEAQRDFPNFRGSSERELAVWLRRMLENNVLEQVERHVGAQKRSIFREFSMDDSGGGDGVALRHALPSDLSSPSQRVMRGEASVRLAHALDKLPDGQREAVRLRHLEGWSLSQIAEHLDRSEVAVAGLIKRGLQALRRQFHVAGGQ